MIIGLLICSALAFATGIEIDVYPIVHAPIGSFQGSISKSRNGKDISSFLGIRYAEAPTRETRFKQAAVVQPHEGTFNAINFGPICPQPVSGNKTISEDCLRLNIHTTLIPTNESNRPVFVFIHGGGFLTGSGSQYRPELMLDSEIVLVTINYRLGALGFLSTGDEYAPGNAGFKDQVQALRWIKQNIRAFGGDPNSVVLFGHEAGALSAAMHIFSPMSKGLFHRVIMMDGAPTLYKPLLTNQLDPAKKFAQVLGCSIDTRDNMFDCLYTKPAEDFGSSISQLTDVNVYLAPIFTPALESAATVVNRDEQFLTAQPIDIIRERKINAVPINIGSDVYEFVNPPTEFDYEAIEEFNKNWQTVAPKLFGYENHPRSSFISNELKSYYFNSGSIGLENIGELFKVYDDALTNYPIYVFVKEMSAYSNQPIHVYYDRYKCCETYPQWSNGTHFSLPHYDELSILFPYGSRACKEDTKNTGEAMGMLYNFAKSGSIAGWTATTIQKPQYLEYDGFSTRMIAGLMHSERMKKWSELFPVEPIQHSDN